MADLNLDYELKLRENIESAMQSGDAEKELIYRNGLEQFMRWQDPNYGVEKMVKDMPSEMTYSGLERTPSQQRRVMGMGKAFMDLKRGVQQLIAPTPELQQDIDASKTRDKPLMATPSGLGGNIAGNIAAAAPAAFIPGANTVAGGAAISAGLGALEPVATGESRVDNAIRSGVGGLVGGTALASVRRLIAPQYSDEVTKLLKEGVPLTPGTIMGGPAKQAEDALRSTPFLGYLVEQAQNRQLTGMNKALFNRALAPVGAKVRSAGFAGYTEAKKILNQKYDEILPQINLVRDSRFNQDMQDLITEAWRVLPKTQRRQFENLIEDKININFDAVTGEMSGEVFKRKAGAGLARAAANYARSSDADQRTLGDFLFKARDYLADLMERSAPTPQLRGQLRDIDSAYRDVLTLREVVRAAKAQEGIGTPYQVLRAMEKRDMSPGKEAFTLGQVPMQQIARAGQSVLPQTLRDSGTPARLLWHGAGAAGLGAGTTINPAVGIAAGTAALPYTRAGGALTRMLMSSRPYPTAPVARGMAPFLLPSAVGGGAYARER